MSAGLEMINTIKYNFKAGILMDLSELLEDGNKDLVIIYPGRFHPFHIGHGKVYKYLKQKYSNAKVFISTSGKVDGDRSPFTFEEKKKMMILAGVDSGAIVQTKSPYQSIEIMERFDKDKTVVVFAVSEKDMAEDPRFDFSNGLKLKKNGEPAYLQKWNSLDDAETFGTRGYIATTPTFKFKVRGQEINSASQIRNMIASSDDTMLTQMLQDLYSVTDVPQDIIDLFKNKVGNKETMNENWDEHSFSEFLKENVYEDNIMKKGILTTITEGKSPHKKGTKKYNAHMAAMHAESIDEEFDRKVKEVLEAKTNETDGNDQQSKLEYIHMALSASKDGDLTFDEMTAGQALEYVKEIKVEREEDKKKLSYISTTLSASIDEDSYFDEQMADQALEYVEDIIERPLDEETVKEEKQIRAKEGDYEFGKDLSNDISFVTYKGQVISQGDFDQGADGWFMWIPGVEGQEFFSKPEDVVAYFSKHNITEEVNEDQLDEYWPILGAAARLIPAGAAGAAGTVALRTGQKIGAWIGDKWTEWTEDKPEKPTNEGESGDRPYIVVHAKKGKYQTYASSSYDAAKNAAKHWGLKSTAGVSAYLADVEHVAEDNGYANDQHEMLEYIHHVLQECGDGNMDITMVEQALEYVEDIREQHFDADGSTKSESVNEEEVSVDTEGNIVGYLDTVDEYVAQLFKLAPELGMEGATAKKIAYRIQNAVDDIRTRELGLKPSNIRSQHENLEEWSWKKPLTFDRPKVIGTKVDRSKDVKTINLPVGNLKSWLKEDAEAEEKVSILTKMQKVYNHNEDRNAHSENILMLAQAFGDRGEIKAIEGLLSITKRQGYVTPEQSEIMYNSIHKKYIKELFPLNEVWPALAVAGAAGYGLYKYGKKAGQKAGEYLKKHHGDGIVSDLVKGAKTLITPTPKKKEFNALGNKITKVLKNREDAKEGVDLFKLPESSIMHYSDAKGTAKYSEGYKAARKGVKYDENPYSGAEKLQWSKGHNDFRADKMSDDGEANYGARGQFE